MSAVRGPLVGGLVVAPVPMSNITSAPVPPSPLPAAPIKSSTAAIPTHDEDESSLSSSGTDPSDVFSNGSTIQKAHWTVDRSGAWQRHGSSESATSTTISSNGPPSASFEDKSNQTPSISLTSKKRMSDGTMKLSPPASDIKIKAEIHAKPESAISEHTTEEASVKRRGRPVKPKQDVSGYIPTKRRASFISQLEPSEVRPRSSIPTRLSVAVFANQCIKAAQWSRLDPYALHTGEHDLLADLLMNQEVTIYLNIRNAILRIWCQNPSCAVTPEEAAGCAKDGRFFGLAEVAYKWLVRNGYINFGCVEVPRLPSAWINKKNKDKRQRTVVVIGAGVSGLTAARQLEGLFAQHAEKWTDSDEQPPRVVVLEGRKRIGGRVYSKPLRDQEQGSLPDNLRNTAEMGAMIVTGFEHGNPLDTVIRGQLGLRYHLMADRLTIYDCDGKPVNERQDMLNTDLYTDISDRAGWYRAAPQRRQTLQGDEDLVKRCRDPAMNGLSSFQLEPMFDPLDNTKRPSFKRGRRRNAPPGTEKLTGRSRVIEETGSGDTAAEAAKAMGWALRDGISGNHSLSLDQIAHANIFPTLGAVMDGAIEQYQSLINIKARDMRLLNWHHANLEYANAAPVSSLSLSGHDQDTGNEFEGAHSEIIGGYSQLPRGLLNLPTRLDVRLNQIVDSIHYDDGNNTEVGDLQTKVVLTNGDVIEADQVVLTAPLGVLKTDMIDFDPPLPSWKRGAISRMGFGLLNKVILLYDKPFWDESRDMFGLLNEPDESGSLNPAHYAKNRGRFYLIWNASRTSGRPMLIALMAGKAAHDAETTNTDSLMREITARLRKVYGANTVPAPREVIVTRWKRDPFTRGTYSYVGPETRPSDYDLMARSVGNLHFGGEATCGTHPATVHGAFLSGLRVAADVFEAMVGPIRVPQPLVSSTPIKTEDSFSSGTVPFRLHPDVATPRSSGSTQHIMASQGPSARSVTTTSIKQEEGMSSAAATFTALPHKPIAPRHSVCAGDSSFWAQPVDSHGGNRDYEAAIIDHILNEIGGRPVKPPRPGVNPFLMYTKDKWDECKTACSTPTTTAGRDVIRQTLGRWWKQAPDDIKQPYISRSQAAQEQADKARKEWEKSAAQWDSDAARLRSLYVAEHPQSAAASAAAKAVLESWSGGVSKRKTNVSNNVVLDHHV